MKTTFNHSLKAGLLAVFAITSFASFAQNKKEKSTTRIRIEQDINGNTKVHEKSFDVTGLTDKQKENLIQKYQDSVMAKNKENVRGTKVEVESFTGDEKERELRNDDGDHFSYNYNTERPRVRAYSRGRNGNDNEHFEFRHGDDDIVIRDKPRVRVYRRDGKNDDLNENLNEDLNLDLDMKDFNLDMKGLNEGLNQMGKDLQFEFRSLPDVFAFDGSSSSKTVRGLNVYPNNPKTDILNLRFSSQEKGDVTIKVMDVKGNVIAKDEIKDFSGEYVGQINIGKQKGVVFVMVTQGEDGTVKRVNLPSDKE